MLKGRIIIMINGSLNLWSKALKETKINNCVKLNIFLDSLKPDPKSILPHHLRILTVPQK